MRYAEQLRHSWGYHWGIFREIWDMFTLRNWCWFIVGSLVVLCVVPMIISHLASGVGYYVRTPVPAFFPSLSQELAITDYLSRPIPSILTVVNYYWVGNSGFQLLVNVLCITSAGLLLVAYLREGGKSP